MKEGEAVQGAPPVPEGGDQVASTEPDRSGDLRFAVALTVLAGAVDAIGFLKLGGLFVAFMSGDTTQAAVALILQDGAHLAMAMALIGLFVGGAFTGALVGWAAGRRRRTVLLALVTALLAGALAASRTTSVGFSIGLMALAMGAQTAVFGGVGGVGIGPTTVTGTLARLGEGLALAATGRGGSGGWSPYLLLWLGLVAGGAAATLIYARYGISALAAPAFLAALLTWAESRRPLAPERMPS